MPCSPLLRDVTDPCEVLRIVRANPLLCASEPSSTFYPLEERGWARYAEGRWQITVNAPEAETPREDESLTVAQLFNL